MDAPSTDIQQILEARAAALAQPLNDATIVDGEVQLVVLALGDEQYGVESQWVEEVQPSAASRRFRAFLATGAAWSISAGGSFLCSTCAPIWLVSAR